MKAWVEMRVQSLCLLGEDNKEKEGSAFRPQGPYVHWELDAESFKDKQAGHSAWNVSRPAISSWPTGRQRGSLQTNWNTHMLERPGARGWHDITGKVVSWERRRHRRCVWLSAWPVLHGFDQLWVKMQESKTLAHYTEGHCNSWKSATTGHPCLGCQAVSVPWWQVLQQTGNNLEVMLRRRFIREALGWDFNNLLSTPGFYFQRNSEN